MTATQKGLKILPLLRRAAAHARELYLLKEAIRRQLDVKEKDLNPPLSELLRCVETDVAIPDLLTSADAVELVLELGDYCDTCGEDLTLDDGEGFNGECGSCADKTETKRLEENPDDCD